MNSNPGPNPGPDPGPNPTPSSSLIKFGVVDKIASSASDSDLFQSFGVPVDASNPGYNHISFSHWTFSAGPQGSLYFWVNPRPFLSDSIKSGKTLASLRTEMKQKYSTHGVKVLVRAFGPSEFPTTAGYHAGAVASYLATFVTQFNLDGVDIDYQDDEAFVKGTAEQWLKSFITVLRTQLPSHTIVCTVKAGYFVGWARYSKGAFLNVHNQKGSLIDFYNVRYFGQDTSTYNSSTTLFNQSSGWAVKTSVNELVTKGIDAAKIVIGKPATVSNADSTSYMSPTDLSQAISAEYQSSGWKTGVMLYEIASDLDGSILRQIVQPIANV